MADQTLTLHISDDFYHRLKQRAEFRRRSIEEELLNLATNAMVEDEIPADILEAVAALAQLDDQTLWQVARSSRLSPEQSREIEELNFKRQRGEALTPEEQQRLADLLHQYDKALLVRAHAVGQLKERGQNVDVLLDQP
ncbi:MAG TPA: hypothetical protein VH590_10610 [Ktedonobacterales bacterium]|jgi:plasmid stability protein